MTPAQAESAALQAVCAYPHLIAQVGLEPEDFADKRRRDFLGALRETRYFTETGAASPLEVATRAGIDRQWIAQEFNLTFSVEIQAKDLARQLREISVSERYARKIREVMAAKRGADLIEAIAAVTRQYQEMSTIGGEIGDMETATVAYLDQAERDIKIGKVAGLATGLPTLNKAIRGFRAGELTTLVAAGGVGKSTLADFWRRLLAQERIYSILFSGEMTEEQLGERLAYAEMATPLSEDLRDLRAIDEARERILSTAIYRHMLVDSSSTINIGRAKAIVQSKKAEHGSIGLVVGDHVRHMEISGLSKNALDAEKVAEAAQLWKNLAKECKVAALLLCHVSQEGVKVMGANGTPNPSVILGGPRIFNISDNVIALWRSENLRDLYVWKGRQTGTSDIKIPLEFDLLTQSYSEAR